LINNILETLGNQSPDVKLNKNGSYYPYCHPKDTCKIFQIINPF
jgi:hypothetical protein